MILHLILLILYQYLMMRSFLYHLFPLTTIVATLSLASLDQVGHDGDAIQFMTYIPSGNSKDPFEDSGLDLDNSILDWGEVTGLEQAQANKDACSGSNPNRRRRRREADYCLPTAAPPPLRFNPNSHQEGSEVGSERKKTGGLTTTTGEQDIGQPGLLPDKDRLGTLQTTPWSTTSSSVCPENRPVAVCAGADLQPSGQDQGWQQIPFSNPLPSPEELLYWPYCRLWTYNLPCKIELNLEMFFCCESFTKNVPKQRETIFQLRVWRYMTLEYPYNGHSCIPAIEPRVHF